MEIDRSKRAGPGPGREAQHAHHGVAGGLAVGAHGTDTDAKPITIRELADRARRGERFACLAVYDALMASIFERAGVPLLLAGDSAAQVVLGLRRTIDIPLDVLVALTAAVRRGAPRSCVMADMPFLSYHGSLDSALRNAGRFMTEGGADIVKLEADASFAPVVEAMTRAGIPVCAHVGMHPQRSALAGGFLAAGRTAQQALAIVEDARELQRAGAVMVLVEAVPDVVARRIVEDSSVPVIGIGAGPACHGQILVAHDLLGLTGHVPGFVGPTAGLASAVESAGRAWVERVAKGEIVDRYRMPDDEAKEFRAASSRSDRPMAES